MELYDGAGRLLAHAEAEMVRHALDVLPRAIEAKRWLLDAQAAGLEGKSTFRWVQEDPFDLIQAADALRAVPFKRPE